MANLERLKEAYAIIDGIPASNILLRSVVSTKGPTLECGTIACAAGWLMLHPTFLSDTKVSLILGSNTARVEITKRGKYVNYITAMMIAFDLTILEAEALFSAVNNSKYDKNLPYLTPDKEIWQNRVKLFLKEQNA